MGFFQPPERPQPPRRKRHDAEAEQDYIERMPGAPVNAVESGQTRSVGEQQKRETKSLFRAGLIEVVLSGAATQKGGVAQFKTRISLSVA